MKTTSAGKWGEYLVLFGLVALFLWRGFIPAWKTLNSDFPNYYLAARLCRLRYPLDQAYDWVWFQREADHAGLDHALVAFVPLTPFSALPVLPVALLPPLRAKRVWLVANLVLLFLTAYVLTRITRLGRRRIGILVFLAIVPLRANFLLGQQHLLVLFLLTLSAWLYLEGRAAGSGGTLALAAALKLYPALFLVFFLRKKQWRAAAALSAGSLGLALVSCAIFGWSMNRAYMFEILPRLLRGEAMDPYNPGLNSFNALLHRLFIAEPELNPNPLLHSPPAYATLLPLIQAILLLSFLWVMRPGGAERSRQALEWGAFIALLLLVSSQAASYYFCALILTAALVLDALLKLGERALAASVLVLYGLVCLPLQHFAPQSPSGWQNFLAFPRLALLTGLWMVLLWSLSAPPCSVKRKFNSSQGAIFCFVFAALWAGGAFTNIRHVKRSFNAGAARAITIPDSIMAGEPAVATDNMLFTAISLNADMYLLGRSFRGRIDFYNFGIDAFHSSLLARSNYAWVELASSQSRVVRFSFNHSRPSNDKLSLEAGNAEQPAVSADGKWLAFLRERQGRGSLWIKPVQASREGPRVLDGEMRLLDETYDVRDVAFFPDDRIAFAAQPGGTVRLFVIDRLSGRAQPLTPVGEQARDPAISADGKWLAFSRRQFSNWQLMLMDLHTGEERSLTSGDCNSVNPAWIPGGKGLVFASDCSRGLGLTALWQIPAP